MFYVDFIVVFQLRDMVITLPGHRGSTPPSLCWVRCLQIANSPCQSSRFLPPTRTTSTGIDRTSLAPQRWRISPNRCTTGSSEMTVLTGSWRTILTKLAHLGILYIRIMFAGLFKKSGIFQFQGFCRHFCSRL